VPLKYANKIPVEYVTNAGGFLNEIVKIDAEAADAVNR